MASRSARSSATRASRKSCCAAEAATRARRRASNARSKRRTGSASADKTRCSRRRGLGATMIARRALGQRIGRHASMGERRRRSPALGGRGGGGRYRPARLPCLPSPALLARCHLLALLVGHRFHPGAAVRSPGHPAALRRRRHDDFGGRGGRSARATTAHAPSPASTASCASWCTTSNSATGTMRAACLGAG